MASTKSAFFLACMALTPAFPAGAHMPYVAPTVFDAGQRSRIAVEASFTENAFRPEIAMKDAPFEITGPDGLTHRLGAPILLSELAIIEAELPADGIYRISSGQRFGRMNRMYKDGTGWKLVAEDAPPPAGAALQQVQSATLADAYVSRGKPGAAMGALTPRRAALEIHPLGDPTSVGADEAFALEILYEGKALAGATVSLFREAGYYDGKASVGDVVSSADGKISVTPPDAGRYLLLLRHRAAAPAGADAPYYSYTVTLAFEAS